MDRTEMETLCKIRDIYRAVSIFEAEMEHIHNLCLNEGMLLCVLSKSDNLSSGELAETLGLTTSNASKVIRSVEEKGLIHRVLGKNDKRQMYFSLTKKGKEALINIKCDKMDMPAILREIVQK